MQASPPPVPGYGLRPSRAASGLGPRLNRRVLGSASNTLNRLGSSSKLGSTRLNRRVLGSASNTLNRLGSSSKLGFTRLNRRVFGSASNTLNRLSQDRERPWPSAQSRVSLR